MPDDDVGPDRVGDGATALAVVTPTYAPDFELFCDLHRSVLAFTAPSVVHYAITPARDVPLFAPLAGPRLVVWTETDVLPQHLVGVPGTNWWVNLRRPFPPVRGWIAQQILKLSTAAQMVADVVVLVDSDVLFIRPVTAAHFVRDSNVRFYRNPGVVDHRLPRHVKWHAVSRRMLGLPPRRPPLPDYVSSFNVWEPRIVRELQRHITKTTHRHWADAIASQRHFSEWTLYGVFVDEILGHPANAFTEATTLCHSYWDTVPLDSRAAAAFVADLQPDDVAIMISAKSRTPLGLRRAAQASVRETPD